VRGNNFGWRVFNLLGDRAFTRGGWRDAKSKSELFQQEDDRMGISARIGIMAVAAVVAGGVLLSSEAINAAMSAKEAIEARKQAMKDMSADNKAIKAFLTDGKGTTATVGDKASEIAATAKQIVALFPKGSGRGDFSDKETRALPKIWSDWTGYENAATVMVVEAGKLAEIAKTGDKGMIAEQFAKMGKEGCGGCHKVYRGAKAK
jgi:cytochrome c556